MTKVATSSITGAESWTPEEDWFHCERHARNILGEDGFTRFMANLSGQEPEQPAQPAPHVAEPSPADAPGTPGAQRRLFPGEPTLFGDTRGSVVPAKNTQIEIYFGRSEPKFCDARYGG